MTLRIWLRADAGRRPRRRVLRFRTRTGLLPRPAAGQAGPQRRPDRHPGLGRGHEDAALHPAGVLQERRRRLRLPRPHPRPARVGRVRQRGLRLLPQADRAGEEAGLAAKRHRLLLQHRRRTKPCRSGPASRVRAGRKARGRFQRRGAGGRVRLTPSSPGSRTTATPFRRRWQPGPSRTSKPAGRSPPSRWPRTRTAGTATTVAASALRLSFKTDRPLFPYREPDPKDFAQNLEAKRRLLRIYFVAEARYQGELTEEDAVDGPRGLGRRAEAGRPPESAGAAEAARGDGAGGVVADGVRGSVALPGGTGRRVFFPLLPLRRP